MTQALELQIGTVLKARLIVEKSPPISVYSCLPPFFEMVEREGLDESQIDRWFRKVYLGPDECTVQREKEWAECRAQFCCEASDGIRIVLNQDYGIPQIWYNRPLQFNALAIGTDEEAEKYRLRAFGRLERAGFLIVPFDSAWTKFPTESDVRGYLEGGSAAKGMNYLKAREQFSNNDVGRKLSCRR